MTDEPPNRGATPDEIEAALQDVRAGLAAGQVPHAPPARHEEGRRSDWLGVGAFMVAAAFLGGAAALFLPGLTGIQVNGADDARERIGALEDRIGRMAAGSSNGAAADSYRDLASRLDGLDVRVRALEATAGAAGPTAAPSPESPETETRIAALDSALADFGTRLEAVEQGLAQLAAAPPPAPAMPAPAAPAPDAAALAGLVAEVQTLSSQLGDLATRLGAVETALPAPDLVAALDRRLSDLENADPGRAARNAALALAVSRLADAVASGRPFAAELAALSAAAPALDLAPFEPYAGTGLPTLRRLAEQLEALDPAIRAGADEDRGGDWLDWLWRGLTGLVTVRSSGEPLGDEPEDRLERARLRLADGDLAAAAGEIEWLWGRARAAADPWLASANARLALDRALAGLTAEILQDLSRPAP